MDKLAPFEIGVMDLSSEVDAIWKRQQHQRKQTVDILKKTTKNFFTAANAEQGKTYSVYVEEDGKEQMVKAEFIGHGRREWRHLMFFRRALKNGKHMIHGVQNYSIVKEITYTSHERE